MKKKIALMIVELIRNIVSGLIVYIACVFVEVGMFYIECVNKNIRPTEYLGTEIHQYFDILGFCFLVITLMLPFLNAIIKGEWLRLLSNIVAVTLILLVMHYVPEFIQWITTANVNNNSMLLLCLCVINIILKFVLQVLDKNCIVTANICRVTGWAKKGEKIE
jgi:hypothetical protein